MEIHVDGWRTNIRFSSAHFIPRLGKCSRIHGHDYGIQLRLFGVRQDGILIDFTDLKGAMREAISDLDHKLLLPAKSREVSVAASNGEVEIRYEDKRIVAPEADVHLCDVEVTSSEELSFYIASRIAGKLAGRKNLRKLEVCVEEGPGQGSFSEIDLNE